MPASHDGRCATATTEVVRTAELSAIHDSAVLYTADVVCPMTGPPLDAGGVLVAGERILAVGAAAALRAEADREHRIAGVLLPALVNAHTHLEFADAGVVTIDGSFADWLARVASTAQEWDDQQWSASARHGVHQSLRAGAGCIGDVVTRGYGVPAAARAGLAGDSWLEVAGVDRDHADEVLAALEDSLALPAGGRRLGIAPHSAYKLGIGVMQALGASAGRLGVPLHIHAAESREEVVAIRDGAGPLAERAAVKGHGFEWLDGGTGLTPVSYLEACGVLSERTSIAHGVWVDPEEAGLLAERGTAVVCCPRSNELLGVGQAPLEYYADAGTALALGTDGATSSPDGDVLAETPAWVRLASRRGLRVWSGPSGPVPLPEQAIRLVTVDGAAAMGWGQHSGVLAPGRRADLVGVGMQTAPDTVYRDLVVRGVGRQVLTVVGGVRKARRDSADVAWPDPQMPIASGDCANTGRDARAATVRDAETPP